MNQDDYWDCPYCEQPMPPDHDKECHCGMRVSHHLSVPALCKQLRETQQRESALIVDRNKHHQDADAFLDRWAKAQERAICAERERDAERALADRLAEALPVFDYRAADYMHPTSTDVDRAIAALAAWKEARSE